MKNMNEWAVYNCKKIELAKKRIEECIRNNRDFKIFLFDIDDTLNKSRKATEEQVQQINFKASEKYRKLYEESHPFFGDQIDNANFNRRYWDLRNQVLEDYGPYLGAIDYSLIHREENLYENAKLTLNNIAEEHDENTFVFILTHYNPEREAAIKVQKYYEYTLDSKGDSYLDGILTLPVFIERYEPNGKNRQITSKALPVIQQLKVPPRYLNHCILIDDSGRVRKDFKEKGGIVIPAYLEKGYLECFEDDKNDRQRVITGWDPYIFNMILQKIDYERKIGIAETKNYKIKRK